MKIELNVSDPPSGKEYSGFYICPDTAQACIELWGDKVVLTQVAQRLKARLSHKVRTWIGARKSTAEISDKLKNYMPSLHEVSEDAENLRDMKKISAEADPKVQRGMIHTMIERLQSGDTSSN